MIGRSMEQVASSARRGSGLAYGVLAYVMWGVFPIYFKLVASVSPWVVVCHRILWSTLFLAVIISVRREWNCIRPAITSARSLLLLSLGAVLIAANWLIFIYAVSRGLVLQSSLGYFMMPLLTILLGMLFLGERLRRMQWVAVSIAGFAVANLALRGTVFPWVAILLALSFGFYGLVRKKVDINSLHALFVETALLVPVALILLALLPGSMQLTSGQWGVLSMAGLVTALPMLLFGAALRSLRMSTMGFLQYIGPTLQFVVAVFLFDEVLDPVRLVSFLLCWAAIVLYVADSVMLRRAALLEPE